MVKKILTTTIIGGAAVAGGLALNNEMRDDSIKERASDVKKSSVSTADASNSSSSTQIVEADGDFGAIVTPDFAPSEEANARVDAYSYSTPAQEVASASANAPAVSAPSEADNNSAAEQKNNNATKPQTAAKQPQLIPTNYIVAPEDTMYSIAERFNLNVNDLISYNGNTSLIYAGQSLSLTKPATNNNVNPTPGDEVIKTPAQDWNDDQQGNNASVNLPQKPTAPVVPNPAPVAPGNSNQGVNVSANIALATQLTTMGIPYVWGGGDPETGMDCSGLVQYVYQNASGIDLPHNTVMQEPYFSNKPVEQAQVGDLLFWGEPGATYHVAIFIGGGQYIDAPEPGRDVGVYSIEDEAFPPSFAGSYIG